MSYILKIRFCILAFTSLCCFVVAEMPMNVRSDNDLIADNDLASLRSHHEKWPAQLTLKCDVKMKIVADGKEIGSIVSPAGCTVNCISIDDKSIEIGVEGARAKVSPSETDIWEREALLGSRSNPVLVSTPAPVPLKADTVEVQTIVQPVDQGTHLPDIIGKVPVNFEYEAPARNNFTKAAFRFWAPSEEQVIRGAIVLVPGVNGDGRGMINDREWQEIARRYNLILVGCCFQGTGDYYEAKYGTGTALLSALIAFGKHFGHEEVAMAPLLLYGESAGGEFDYNFTLWQPGQVMAFVVNKGEYYDDSPPNQDACTVPGLFFIGERDSEPRIQAVTNLWKIGRKSGAHWALAPQPNSGHEFSKTSALSRTFFESVLKRRLISGDHTSGDGKIMRSMDEANGWLGDPYTHEIHNVGIGDDSAQIESWFPDQASAEAWRDFVSEGG
jgi:hypothetical protein